MPFPRANAFNGVLWMALTITSGYFSTGCKTDSPSIPNAIDFPSHFPAIAYSNNENKPTQEGIALGRALFYDKNLSLTRTISCGSCHAQVHGFADHNLPVSYGIFNRKGNRNAPALINLAWQPTFMWDGGINHLDFVPLAPLTDSNEMGLSINNWIERVKEQPQYRSFFLQAFKSDSITEKRTLFALSQFLISLVSSESKYDKFLQNKATFTASEAAGYKLFQSKCSQCHTEPLLTNHQFERNSVTTSGIDRGRMRITEIEEDRFKFKVPTLRNIALTYPYMHNGSMATLEEVLMHYGNLESNPNNPKLGNPKLSQSEQKLIIDFLHTLTDPRFISNHAFSEP